MKRYQLAWLALMAATAAALLPETSRAQGVISVVEDFEGELPGLQSYPGGYSFFGGGLAGGGEASPTATTEITEGSGFSSLQAFVISIDATVNAGSYFYGGVGGFFRFHGTGFGFAQGQPGASNPANYEMSFDLKVVGNNGDQGAMPVGGSFAAYKTESGSGVDMNNDGDMLDGFDKWVSRFDAHVTDNNYTHVVWNLAQGSAPTADPFFPSPQFDDETTFAFQIFFNSGGFGTDAGNVITIDNVQLKFTPSASLPGDFNESGKVDGNDFLVWQRGGSPNPFSSGDLDAWKANFGNPAVAVTVGAVPEPASLLLASGGLACLAWRRRGTRAADCH